MSDQIPMNRPPFYAPPDRAAWEAKHGKPPVMVRATEARHHRARRIVAHDREAETVEQACSLHASMDDQCTGVLFEAGFTEDDGAVWWCPDADEFYLYRWSVTSEPPSALTNP